MVQLLIFFNLRHRKLPAKNFDCASIILDFKMESPNVRKNFTCKICKKGYSTINSKERHIHTVHGEVKKFECNVCGKTFGLKYELRSHIETNGKVKHQKCKFCTKEFSTFGRLSKHITKIHKRHRKYKCHSCEKSFTESRSLKMHLKTIHEAQRNYKCDSCGKKFT